MKRPKRILVTGASGFIGRSLCPFLAERGFEVRGLVRATSRTDNLRAAGVELVQGNLIDRASLMRAVDGIDAVVHLGGAADVSDPDLNQQVNVGGAKNLAAACVQGKVRSLLFYSTHCVVRDKRDAYALTKLQAEGVLTDAGLKPVIFRPTMIYGRGSAEFDLFSKIVLNSPVLPLIGNGEALIQPVALPDALEATVSALQSKTARGRTYQIAGPEQVTFNGLVEMICRAAGKRPPLRLPLPEKPVMAGVRLLGKLMQHPPINVDQALAFTQDNVADISDAQRDLGFAPRPLMQGLNEIFSG